MAEFAGCTRELARKALQKNRGDMEAAGMALLSGEICEGEEEPVVASAGYNTDDSSKAQHGDDELGEQMQGCLDLFGFDDDFYGGTGGEQDTELGTEMVSSAPAPDPPESDATDLMDVGAPAEGGKYQTAKPDFWKVPFVSA